MIVLLIMSVYSIAIMVERYLTYTAAKKQSREFAPRVAQALKNDRIEEAINISDKHRKSHLAMVVSSGLQEFRAHEAVVRTSPAMRSKLRSAPCNERSRSRPLKFKRGLSGLATIGSTAPFVGLFGTVFGIINAFSAMRRCGTSGYRRGGQRYFGSAVYDRARFAGGGAGGVAVQLLHRQGRWLHRRNGQLGFRAG